MKRLFTVVFLLSSLFISAQEIPLNILKNLEPRNIGPGGMSGRVTSIDAVNSNPDIIYEIGRASCRERV